MLSILIEGGTIEIIMQLQQTLVLVVLLVTEQRKLMANYPGIKTWDRERLQMEKVFAQ
jgi:hypothetical protein